LLDFDKDGNFIISDQVEEIEPELDVAKKPKRLDLFKDILPSINGTKPPLDVDIIEDYQKYHSKFLLNKCIASKSKYIELACMLNQHCGSISPRVHYKILSAKISKNKQYMPIFKQDEHEKRLKKISKYFGMNIFIMESYLNLLKESDIKDIEKKIDELEAKPKKKLIKA